MEYMDGTETNEGWEEMEEGYDGGMDSIEVHDTELLEDAREKRCGRKAIIEGSYTCGICPMLQQDVL